MIRILPRVTPALVLFSLLFLSGSPAGGQSLTHGSLEGTVSAAGTTLDGAVLTVRDRATGATRAATTARDGRFEFALLLPGSYDLLVERFGFSPRRIFDIPVTAGGRVDLPIELAPADETPSQADEVAFERVGRASRGLPNAQRFGDLELLGLPTERRELTWLGELSSAGGPGLEVEGLPAHLSGIYVDGLPVTLSRHPSATRGTLDAAHLALSAFEGAELVTGGTDVEWSGVSGGILSGHTRRGTPDLHVEGFGNWSSGSEAMLVPTPLAGSSAASGTYREMQGGFLVSGPLIRDTASFVAGLEVWRVETRAAAPGDSLSARVAAIAEQAHGVTFPDAAAAPLRSDAVSAFLRMDWKVGADHQLSLRSSFASSPEAREGVGAPSGRWRSGRFEGRQASAGADLASQLTERLYQEIRVGADFASRVYQAEPGREGIAVDAVSTRIFADGWTYGTDAGLLGDFRQAAVRGSETLHYHAGAHRLKFGLSAAVQSYDYGYDASRSGEFLFSGLGGFADAQGAFFQTVAASPEATFSVPEFGAFLQDTWRAGLGLEIVAGVRFDAERLPRDQVNRNLAWFERTGLDNADFRATSVRFSPRLSFTWDLQERNRWVVAGSAGLYDGAVDPSLLGELLSHDGSVEVRRGLGALDSWPLLPDHSVAPVLGPRLVLLAPGFAAPRSARLELGISHRPGPRTALHLSSAYRRTDFLPRRRDLNLLPVAVGEDQYGRPLFGTLRRQGGLLMAENLSNRRFPEFEQVFALDVDGWSEYQGVTLTAEHRPEAGIRLSASYTASLTRDNWPGGRGGGLQPAQLGEDAGGAAWSEGISDFDVPHRAVVGVEAVTPGSLGIRMAALYRYRSGYPFTPGFREGVDANADGVFGNDPAFIDPSLPGMAELLDAWPCLRESAGRFALRNACRGPDAHSLDLRLSLRLGRAEDYAVELLVDALNLTATEEAFPDRALYLTAEEGGATLLPSSGIVEVPLRVNPAFGQPLVRLGAGRLFRLGLRMSH